MFSNFSLEELELLVNRIVDSEAPQVLQTKLRVSWELFHNNDLKALRAKLHEKAPNKYMGVQDHGLGVKHGDEAGLFPVQRSKHACTATAEG
ncbi:hypothetical protein BGZ65_000440, partial [Modicella reniformis]